MDLLSLLVVPILLSRIGFCGSPCLNIIIAALIWASLGPHPINLKQRGSSKLHSFSGFYIHSFLALVVYVDYSH